MTTEAEWLKEWFSRKSDVSDYSDEDWYACDFFIEGLVDSLEVIELVSAIEEHFSLQFNEGHFQDRRFTTIGGLCEIIREIQVASAPQDEASGRRKIRGVPFPFRGGYGRLRSSFPDPCRRAGKQKSRCWHLKRF